MDAMACLSAIEWPKSLECTAIQFQDQTTLFTFPENTNLQSLDRENPLLIAIPFDEGDIRGTVFVQGSASHFQSRVSKSLLPFQMAMGLGALLIVALFVFVAIYIVPRHFFVSNPSNKSTRLYIILPQLLRSS